MNYKRNQTDFLYFLEIRKYAFNLVKNYGDVQQIQLTQNKYVSTKIIKSMRFARSNTVLTELWQMLVTSDV